MTLPPSHGALFILVAYLLPSARGDVGRCDFSTRRLPSTPEEFSELASELGGLSDLEEQLPLRLPQRPVAFDLVDVPKSLEPYASENGVLKLLGETRWPRRGEFFPADTFPTVREHLNSTSKGEPLYITQYVNDTRLRRLFHSVPAALRAARRMPVAVLARPEEGLLVHALPEPRWVLQLQGRTIWRVGRQEELQQRQSSACDAHPGLSTCELGPGALLYVPGKWLWNSCTQSEGGLSLAVGAGAYSGTWPPLFHFIAEGRPKQVEELLQQNATHVHLGDGPTSHTALDLAAQLGDLKMAQVLKEYGGRPDDTASKTMLYPLHYASLYGHTDVVKWLLDLKVDPSPRSADAYRPIHYAAEAGHTPVVDALIQARADLHAMDKQQYAPAHFAARAGHLSVLQQLRDGGAELSTTDGKGCEPTIWAAKRGDVSVLSFLLDDEGLSRDARCDQRETAAHHAAKFGHTSVLDALKARRADFSLKDDRKHTPLHTAVVTGMVRVIDWFAKAGMKKISPRTPGLLHLAAHHGRADSVEALLRHGADANAADPMTKTTAIEFASTPEVYELLNEHSAKMPDGWVHRVASRGQLDLLRHMVPKRKELEQALSQRYDGVYPVHLAAQGAERDTVSWLCGQMGADCAARTDDSFYGRTALHFACLGDREDEKKEKKKRKSVARLETVKYLINEVHLAADVTDNLNITPVELAGVSGHLAVVKYLMKEHKVDPEGMWQAKRARALNKAVDDWLMGYVPKGTYEEWLRLDKPGRKGKKEQKEDQERKNKPREKQKKKKNKKGKGPKQKTS